jgi:hypothetical protein
MRRSKPITPKRLLLAGLLLLLALAPTQASATESPAWLIAGKSLSELKLSSESLSGSLAPETTAQLSVPGLSTTIFCGTMTLEKGAIESTDKGTLTLAFSKCTAEKVEGCAVTSFTVKAKGSLKAHAGKVYEFFEPAEGANFAVILISGAKCVLPKENALTGSFAAPVKNDEEEAEQAIAPVTSEATLTLLGVGLKFGKQSATLSSPLWLSLSGANKGKVWASAPKPGPVLCAVELELCPAISVFPEKTEVKGALAEKTEAVLSTSLATPKCTTASITGQTLESEGGVLNGEVSAWKFESCKSGATSCTVTAKNLPYKATSTYTEAGNGTIAISALKEAPGIEVVCGSLISCTFASPSQLAFEGGEPGAIKASEAALSVVSGSKCPEKAGTISAAWVLQQPGGGNAQMAQRGAATTVLCPVNPPLDPATRRLKCPVPALPYSGEVRGSLVGGFKATFKVVGDPTKVVTCAEASFAGKFDSDGKYASPGGITDLKFTGAGGGQCTSTLTGANPPVTVSVLNLPYSQSVISYARTSGPQGYIGFEGAAAAPVRLLLNYAGLICVYGPVSFDGAISNALASTVRLSGVWGAIDPGGTCVPGPSAIILNAELKFSLISGGAEASAYVAAE